MDYYKEIKEELVNNEIYKKVKDYSKNRSDLNTYYEVGRLLVEAQVGEERAKYGDGLIKEYSKRLTMELGKGYTTTSLKRMRQFYLLIQKGAPLAHQLTWSHYLLLLTIKDKKKIRYYTNQIIKYNLSKRELRERIKNKEYERLSDSTKEKIELEKKEEVQDLIKNPILIRNENEYKEITEKGLKRLILEDIDFFLMELGEGYCYIKNEYKIKIGDRYNYIDLLLFNIKYNCYVVVELKITELKKEHIGQITTYMHYVDQNIRTINQEKTIGIIIVRKDNKFIMEYCSDKRVYQTTYALNEKSRNE